MSDICDDADGVRGLTEAGARFGRRTSTDAKKTCRKCGSSPVFRPHCVIGKEIMRCMTCGKETEPLKSRQALWVMWNGMN